MACDTRLKPRQTIQQRAEEVRKVVLNLSAGLVTGRYQIKVDRASGAVAFSGLSETERDGVTDACAYRLLMVTGSALAKTKIAAAEQLAGRSVSRHAHTHSHDGGKTWHHNH